MSSAKRAARPGRAGKPAPPKDRHHPAVDTGNHEHFAQIAVPPQPAPERAIVRECPDVYAAHAPGETTYWASFKDALAAIYPALRGRHETVS